MVATFNGFNNGGARCEMQKADINRKNNPLSHSLPTILPILPLRVTVTFPLCNNGQVTVWRNFIVTETNENAAP